MGNFEMEDKSTYSDYLILLLGIIVDIVTFKVHLQAKASKHIQ